MITNIEEKLKGDAFFFILVKNENKNTHKYDGIICINKIFLYWHQYEDWCLRLFLNHKELWSSIVVKFNMWSD